MEDEAKERVLKEELEKIEQLKQEVAAIEKMQKQQLREENHTHNDKHHEKAKRSVTHGEPKPNPELLKLLQSKPVIAVFVSIVVLAIVLIPTKTIEVTEAVSAAVLEPYNVTEEGWVTELQNLTEEVGFRFESEIRVVPSKSGAGNEYVLWEIKIKNLENETGCWEYEYDVEVDGEAYDSGTIENMCVYANDGKVFTTPLYDLGVLNEDEKIEYSAEVFASKIPTKAMIISTNQTVFKNTTVIKYRNVTKETNETKNKTVNWLLNIPIFS
jgi:hypothetical protein